MEALSKIQETSRILQLLEEETKQLKEKASEEENDLSELADNLEARNKEALLLIKGLETEVESLSDENRRFKELEEAVPSVRTALENEISKVKTLEEEIISKDQENSSLKDELESLKDEISKVKTLEEEIISKDQENSSLKDELESLKDEISKVKTLEEEIISKDQENSSLKDELESLKDEMEVKESLKGKLVELEGKLAQREKEVTELKRKLIDTENDTSARIEVLITQMNELQQDMTVERESSLERLSHVKNENAELASKVSDQESILQEQEDTIVSLRGDSNQAMVRLEEAVDRKMAEMGKEFRKNFEADIRIMKQRIRVAEQVQSETKENCTKIKERCEQEHSGLDKKVQVYSRMIAVSKGEVKKFFNAANETLAGLESSFEKFGEMEVDFSGRISRIIDEIVVMKNVIKKKAESELMVEVSVDVDDNELKEQVKKVEEKEEDLRSMRRVDELQRRVNELEKSGREKEETIFELVQEKKEAIKQLCIPIEYYQDRCDYLAILLSSSNKSMRGRRRA